METWKWRHAELERREEKKVWLDIWRAGCQREKGDGRSGEAKTKSFILIKANRVREGSAGPREQGTLGRDGYFNPAVARQATSCTQHQLEECARIQLMHSSFK